MKKPDLIIVAAGSGRRLGSEVPKALIPVINDVPLITTTLDYIGSLFRKCYVVVKDDEEDSNECHMKYWHYWHSLFRDVCPLNPPVELLPISSGRGDGHALLQALEHIASRGSGLEGKAEVVVMWGDVFIPDRKLVTDLIDKPLSSSGIMPVLLEENPYVTIVTEKNGDQDTRYVKHADFSKHGETHDFGFHDQSIFKFNRCDLLLALRNLDKTLDKNGTYLTKGGELSTLHTFHHFYNVSKVNRAVLPMQAYPITEDLKTYSFNTPYELEQMKKELNL